MHQHSEKKSLNLLRQIFLQWLAVSSAKKRVRVTFETIKKVDRCQKGNVNRPRVNGILLSFKIGTIFQKNQRNYLRMQHKRSQNWIIYKSE